MIVFSFLRSKQRLFASILVLSAFLFFRFCLFSNEINAYNNTVTHPSLTDGIAAIYNEHNAGSRQLNRQEIDWLKKGSAEEDLGARWRYHFYSANKNKGLGPWVSAKTWSRYPLGQLREPIGNQTWQKALLAYANNDSETAFIALGHILHLLEDMAVPAHTRLDPHPFGEPYEDWASKNYAVDLSETNVTRLNNLDAYFDVLARYSEDNFFSKDTVEEEKVTSGIDIFKKLNKTGNYVYCVGDKKSDFCFAEIKKDNFGKSTFLLSSLVHSSYHSLLVPKAASAGAGMLELFFNEGERLKDIETSKSWWQRIKDNLLASIGILPAAISSLAPAESESVPISSENEIADNLVVQPELSPIISSAVQNNQKPASVNQAPLPIQDNSAPAEVIAESLTTEDFQIESLPSAAAEISLPPVVAGFISGGGGEDIVLPKEVVSPAPLIVADISSPETILISQPVAVGSSPAAVFVFESNEENVSFFCRLDNASSSVCQSPQTYLNLSAGSHIFRVTAKDAAGNEDISPVEYDWQINVSAPAISGISVSPARNSASISWSNDEAGIFQIEYGLSSSYGLFSATTSACSLTLPSLIPDTAYHFRILSQDNLVNATSTVDNVFVTASQADNLIISELAAKGPNGDIDEFVEIWNPTSRIINLGGWSLQYGSAAATTTWINKYFEVSGQATSSWPDFDLLPGRFFLLASATTTSGYSLGAIPDLSARTMTNQPAGLKLLVEGGKIRLLNNHQEVVDAVAWGQETVNGEGEPIILVDDWIWGSLERKAVSSSTAPLLINNSHQWLGNGYDADNNNNDFVFQVSRNPQNSLMLAEPRDFQPTLLADAGWPTRQQNQFRGGQTSSLLSSGGFSIKWTAETSSGQGFATRPVIDEHDNVYIGRDTGLAKYSPLGELIWFCPNTISLIDPLIAENSLIYVRNYTGLRAIDRESGRLIWAYPLSGLGGFNSSLAVLSDGTIVAQLIGDIYAINPDATLKWIFKTNRTPASPDTITMFAVDVQDNLFFAMGDYVYAVSSSGDLLWEKAFGKGYSAPALGPNNTLFISARLTPPLGGFYALNSLNGEIKWSDFQDSGWNNSANLSPAVDFINNRVYAIMFFNNLTRQLRAYDGSSGSLLWSAPLINIQLAAPMFNPNGFIYVADQMNLKIFAAAGGALLSSAYIEGDPGFYLYFGAAGRGNFLCAANPTKLWGMEGF